MGRVGTPETGTPTSQRQHGGSHPQNFQTGTPTNQGQQAGSYPHNAQTGTPTNQGQHLGSYPQNVQTGQSQYIGDPWTAGGLFDCHLHPTNAIMTALFPFVTFGQVAEVIDASAPTEGSPLNCTMGSLIYLLSGAVCAQAVIGSKYRTKLRKRYGLVEAPYQDFISHLVCPFCSLCQEFRELKKRGLDPDLGWKGVMAREQHAAQYGNQEMRNAPQAQTMSM